MKVILNKDIPNLGEEGEIKEVARGYARNFLIPKDLVMPYSRDSIAILESRREQLAQRREEKRKGALDTKTRLESEVLMIEMPAGDRGRLFGSVTSATIVDALAAKGINVERKRLDIPEKTIKNVGTTRVRVRLYDDQEAELKVIVRASGEAPAEGSAQKSDAAEKPQAPVDEAEIPETAEVSGEDLSEAVGEAAQDEIGADEVEETESDE